MATPLTAPAPRKRSFLRTRLPVVLLALAAAVVAGVWAWPAPEWERVYRVVSTMMVLQVTFLLLAFWLLFLSGLRWWVRLGTILLLALATWAVVRDVQFTGDLVPVVEFRWSPTRDQVLQAHRQFQARLAAPPPQAAAAPATDFPGYRGAQRNGIITGPPLARDWNTAPPGKRWRQPCGGGYASFAVVGNTAVTLEQRGGDEAVVAYDAATGQERWVHAYPAHFSETLGGEGPRATPTVADGDVYSLGATGHLVCLEFDSGRLKWQADILHDNDNIMWGMSGSPLVYDNVVVVNPGTQRPSAANRALLALDRATGQSVWAAGSARAGYSSPMLATLAGRRQVLLFDGEGLAGYDATTGRELWRYPWETQQGINVCQPVVLDGDRVFLSSAYGVGCAVLHVTEQDGRWTAEPVWKNRNMRCRFTSPVLRDGFLYGLDEGILVCLDTRTGERRWKGGRYGHGQLLRSDDLLVVLSETGQLVLVEATPEAHRELGSYPALDGKTWNYPALANGKAYVRNHLEMACYDLRASDAR